MTVASSFSFGSNQSGGCDGMVCCEQGDKILWKVCSVLLCHTWTNVSSSHLGRLLGGFPDFRFARVVWCFQHPPEAHPVSQTRLGPRCGKSMHDKHQHQHQHVEARDHADTTPRVVVAMSLIQVSMTREFCEEALSPAVVVVELCPMYSPLQW